MSSKGKHTVCIHDGEIKDTQFGGAVSPIFMASSYPYLDGDPMRYPRTFNTPNQEVIGKKIAALEHADQGLSFASGMAAISTTLLAFLKPGDHVVFQNEIYGGTYRFAIVILDKFGINYSFTEGIEAKDFDDKITKKTKVLYIETPSNPLLTITDIEAIAKLAKKRNLISMIDNTFASPINQTPLDLGIDISIHSGSKYLGGHSDILAGAVAGSKEHITEIWAKGINLGGNLSDFMCYLLERSMKTLGIRVEKHNENAQFIAEILSNRPEIKKVYYPGLPNHTNHAIAKRQMAGFGGMLSFELQDDYNVVDYQNSLKMIKPTMSLAGVESTIVMPSLTSHTSLTEEEKKNQGISNNLLRFSVGIENKEDIVNDLIQAMKK